MLDVPALLLDGTGEGDGPAKGGIALHLAIAIMTRRSKAGRTTYGVELLAATLDEPWEILFDHLEGIRPVLIVVDGEEEPSTLANKRFAGARRQQDFKLWLATIPGMPRTRARLERAQA